MTWWRRLLGDVRERTLRASGPGGPNRPPRGGAGRSAGSARWPVRARLSACWTPRHAAERAERWAASARPTGSPRTSGDPQGGPHLRGREDPAGRHRARAPDEYPTEIVEGLEELGLFGLMIPEEYGGLGESLLTYALAVEEIARGWMSVSGIINTHFIVAYMLLQHGTEEQKQRYLPEDGRPGRSAARSRCPSRAAAPTSPRSRPGPCEPGRRLRDRRPEDVADQRRLGEPGGGPGQDRRGRRARVYRNMTTFLVEKEAGLRRDRPGGHGPGQDREDGLQGGRHHRADLRGPPDRRRPGPRREPGKGFYQMMDGVEVGRVNVAARGCGVANRAFELGVAYAQQRETFGKQIAEHQAVLFRLAEMATKVEAAHQMMVRAARKKDGASATTSRPAWPSTSPVEYCSQVVEDSFRIHGGYGFSKEYEIERLYREAPMLLIGEGTADIQRMIIGRRVLEDYGIGREAAPGSRAGRWLRTVVLHVGAMKSGTSYLQARLFANQDVLRERGVLVPGETWTHQVARGQGRLWRRPREGRSAVAPDGRRDRPDTGPRGGVDGVPGAGRPRRGPPGGGELPGHRGPGGGDRPRPQPQPRRHVAGDGPERPVLDLVGVRRPGPRVRPGRRRRSSRPEHAGRHVLAAAEPAPDGGRWLGASARARRPGHAAPSRKRSGHVACGSARRPAWTRHRPRCRGATSPSGWPRSWRCAGSTWCSPRGTSTSPPGRTVRKGAARQAGPGRPARGGASPRPARGCVGAGADRLRCRVGEAGRLVGDWEDLHPVPVPGVAPQDVTRTQGRNVARGRDRRPGGRARAKSTARWPDWAQA